ncbi:PH domain-containing protein [Exiguobacterium sp. s191]|uniref:PH domain-containing protein n=1 Tax=Exiguobacterium sp. s191 TaxID=2751196 RepID=UPI001BEAA77D|nr:PH domain-containing protein [Exiguobacterium sp. s191]
MELPAKTNTHSSDSLKKLHPSWIGFKLFNSIKGFIMFCLFIALLLDYSSNTILSMRGLIILGAFVLFKIVSTILEWKHFNYSIDNKELFIEKGRFITMKRHFSIDNIQGIKQNSSLFHRLTGLTSLSIDIGSSERDSAIKLEMITMSEAEQIKQKLSRRSINVPVQEEINDDVHPIHSDTKTHYEVDTKEILIASLTSLSLLFFIFLLHSIYSELSQYFAIEVYVDRVLEYFQSSTTMLVIGISLLIFLSLVYGFLKTYIQYGGFKITSDANRIYVEKGLADKTYFSVPKNKVQALSINSGFIHKMLDITTVKLISSTDTDDEEMKASNILFPFIKRKKAHLLIPEVLPSFKVSKDLTSVPRISILVKILRTIYAWLLAPALIYYFFPSSWYVAVLLAVMVLSSQVFNGIFNGYTLDGSFLQFKKGAIITRTFIMKQEKIERLQLSETFIQRKLGLASLKITIRSMPTKEIVIHDVPVKIAYLCQSWFIEKKEGASSLTI